MAPKKKRNAGPDVDEILARPWCYYCERDFDDLKVLLQHQKAKHFRCERCNRRLNTAGGLAVHMDQVHKERLLKVDNALENRSGLDVEIFGLEGVPDDVKEAHRMRILQQIHQAEADRRAITGNPPPGSGGGQGQGPAKKFKKETKEEMKARLAEFAAAKRAAKEGGLNSGSATPAGQNLDAQSPAMDISTDVFQQAGSPQYTQPPQLYGGAQSVFQQYSQPRQSQQAPADQTYYGFGNAQSPVQLSPFAPPPQLNYGQSFSPAVSYGQSYSSTPAVNFGQSYSPPQHYGTAANQGQSAHNGHFQHPNQGGPPRHFGAGSPPTFSRQPYMQQSTSGQVHDQNGGASSALPRVPGLPQRPLFAPPPVEKHHDFAGPDPSTSGTLHGVPISPPLGPSYESGPNATTVDDLILSAAKGHETAAAEKVEGSKTTATDEGPGAAATEKTDDAADVKAKKGVKFIYGGANETDTRRRRWLRCPSMPSLVTRWKRLCSDRLRLQ
ncbi:C2H2 finger domain-containing protein [Cryomyces antarcticus]